MPKTKDPAGRMGVYKHLNDVPDRHRFKNYTAEYEGRDVWSEHLDNYLFEMYDSDRFQSRSKLIGERWKEHTARRGRHHALARPEDVEAWCQKVLDRFSDRHAYKHWLRVEEFHHWLMFHTEHPHRYNPALMAAHEGGAAREIWQIKIAGGVPREEQE